MADRLVKSAYLTVVLFLVSSGAATSVVNTDDWKTYAKAQNYADINGEETFTVATPSDAEVAQKTIQNPEMLYTTSSPIVSEFRGRTGLNFEGEKKINSDFVSNNSEGYIVISGRFGSDAVSVLPYAAKRNYSLVYYDEDIRLESEKPKLFYGNFDFKPSDKFNNTRLIDGMWQERNFELASKYDSNSAVITPRGFVDPSLVKEEPFLFKMNPQRLASFLDDSDITHLKIKGSENLLFGKRLNILTDKDLKTVVKTGRAFTGISDYRGVYGLKKISTNFRRYNFELSEVSKFNSSINVEFLNKGNTKRTVETVLNSGNQTETVEITLPEFSLVSHTFEVENVSKDLTINYSTERTNSYSSVHSNISSQSVNPYYIEKIDVNRTGTRVDLRLQNKGERDAWAMIQSDNNTVRKELKSGETTDLEFNTQKSEVTVYIGPFRNQYAHSREFAINEKDDGGNATMYVIMLVVVSLVLAVYTFTGLG